MNREILFRAKNLKNQWVYGLYVEAVHCGRPGWKPHKAWIVENFTATGGWLTPLKKHAVYEPTVGQYTGLKDKNGTKIFKGDILKSKLACEYFAHVQYFDGCWFASSRDDICELSDILENSETEVVGNIYDNPELMRTE